MRITKYQKKSQSTLSVPRETLCLIFGIDFTH